MLGFISWELAFWCAKGCSFTSIITKSLWRFANTHQILWVCRHWWWGIILPFMYQEITVVLCVFTSLLSSPVLCYNSRMMEFAETPWLKATALFLLGHCILCIVTLLICTQCFSHLHQLNTLHFNSTFSSPDIGISFAWLSIDVNSSIHSWFLCTFCFIHKKLMKP